MKNKCIFLDRDGVLNVDRVDYVYRMEEFIIPPGVGEALRALKDAGYLLVIITNQSGIAKGVYKREDVYMIHQAIQDGTGVELDDIYFCPYHEKFDSHSLTRKPGSLMIEKAAAKYEVDMDASWMVGDHERDITAGTRAGLRTIRLAPQGTETKATHLVDDLLAASKIILA
ncbi:MAG: HAD family hydrolase [Cytophagaceae bacterium]|jgi:D-glycero-D-manno-heptose 1,7-bisphosphate phosphatase|uniref:D-glycero-alpha-D-manno-heptose-1,7-bisphosphate 7-phosphatase n=1 Tax=Aquirufa regiilacus TaxID=3024868 RepID=UPI001B5EF93E|nr:HAD family hydrolase [Aquirufa sp. LEPPI-3A]MBP6054440.1 HAD family hydrolase [Cytophagaceae bacterium]MDT8886312.1 HAD family hydrolase [Aquirufa sp. LEPPI-3A]